MQTSALRLADGPRLDGVRVLVVNDMRPVRQVVTDILECAGATVTAVDSAEDALEVLQRERPNVLLSDLSMPEGKRSEEHTSELQSPCNLVCRLLLEKKKKINRHRCSCRCNTL